MEIRSTGSASNWSDSGRNFSASDRLCKRGREWGWGQEDHLLVTADVEKDGDQQTDGGDDRRDMNGQFEVILIQE